MAVLIMKTKLFLCLLDENEIADVDTQPEIKSETEDVGVSKKASKKRKRKEKKKPAKKGRVIVRNLPFKVIILMTGTNCCW